MRILVTGGLGVNGCWVTRDLLTMGHEPVVFDNRPDFTLLRDVSDEFAFVQGDITSLEQLDRACKEHRIERICHLAAVYPDTADADPLLGFSVNALATVYVLEAAKRNGIDRVSFTSSIGALSRMTEEHLEPQMVPVNEDFPAYPMSSVYGAAKTASELMGIQYKRLFGIDFAAMRFAAIYGIGKGAERHGSHNMIWGELIRSAIAGRPIVIPQGGDQRLDLTYARDVAQSVVKGCLVDSFEGHVFHIGSGRTYTLNDFADAIRKVIPGAQVEVGPGFDPRGMGPLAYYSLDINRARRELGYEPQYPPEAAIRDWLEWTERLELTEG
ncbi:MAG: NAD(P)-dependent oxidoreductase [Chloroflexi bacterium]|nr:NAD(P)-dependent oxidoreductase [Chloroflexota bacterium]